MNLENYEARVAADPLKRDLELVCTRCGEVLCDVEHEDSLRVLVDVAQAHEDKCR